MTFKSGQLLVDEIVPRIAAVVARSVKLVGCEDVEEVTQDAIAMAAKMRVITPSPEVPSLLIEPNAVVAVAQGNNEPRASNPPAPVVITAAGEIARAGS